MKQIIFISLLSLLSLTLLAQSERKHVRQGNELYFDGKTDKAIEAYEKALQEAPESPEAHFNMGNAYLKQKDYESASASYQTALGLLEGEGQKAAALHNLGNTYLENQKPKEAKEAYQQALRLNPQDEDTRYNLALANKMLQKQEKEQEQENKDEQDQEEGEDKQEQDQEQQDKGEDQEEEKKDGEEKESDQQNKEEQEDESKDGEGKESEDQEASDQEKEAQQMQEGQISKEEAERILEALKNEEQKLQEQLMIRKETGQRKNLDKDW
ncbi:MAG: tetratricopeptide repeat protein [Chitinophagales bacterium]